MVDALRQAARPIQQVGYVNWPEPRMVNYQCVGTKGLLSVKVKKAI